MSKNTTSNKAEPQKDDAAANAPEVDTAAQEAESARLWNEMAARHSDPNGSGAVSESQQDDDSSGEVENEGGGEPLPVKAEVKEGQEQAPDIDPPPASDSQKDTKDQDLPSDAKPPKADASKDAPKATDSIWAKAENDPRTAALKKAWDEAPESARPAIEAAQRRLLDNGQEIHRLRSERSSLKPAAAKAPAKKVEEEPPYDPSKDDEWLKVKADYPDVGDAVEKIITKAVTSAVKQIDARIAPLAESTKAHDRVIQDTELGQQSKILHSLHPDYTEVVTSDGFRDTFDAWLASQPSSIQDMVENNKKVVRSANEASTVFRLFQLDTQFGVKASAPPPAEAKVETKVETKEPAKPATDPVKDTKRRQQLQGSAAVEHRGPGAAASPDKDDADYWWNHWNSRRRESSDASVH